MSDSEFFKIVPMELQEKAKGRANLVENLSRRSSILPGQSLLPLELTLYGALNDTEDINEDPESDVESATNALKPIPFPYKEVTNENLMNVRNRLGIIDLSFSDVDKDLFVGKYPEKYFTWTEKEQLLLVFAESFRKKFNEKYNYRKPLLLAPKNECGIQKFVSTTIRPTAFSFADLIGSWENISGFVADFIEYLPLENPTELPRSLQSPDSLLKTRRGHCFEMATLLCSLLLGHGFDAYVVSGYAVREVTRNDQSRVVCAAIELKLTEKKKRLAEEPKDTPEAQLPPSKYTLKDPIDLKSKFLQQLDQEEQQRVADEKMKAAEEEAERIRIEESLPADELENKRVHSWVLVKLKGDHFFVEPSTGFRYECTDPSYIGCEAVWNNENYMVNRQKEIVGNIGDLYWELLDRAHWERLLDVDADYPEATNYCPKYLDMPLSWVKQLNVTAELFEERFPEQQKVVKYKRTIHEKFAVYKELDGVVERIKTFESLDYERLLTVWEFFTNRADFLHERETDHANNEIMEWFRKGRQDALKSSRTSAKYQEFQFYYKLRFDCLKRIEMTPRGVKEFYQDREDRLKFRHYRFSEAFQLKHVKEQISSLEFIEENFERDTTKPALEDISIRKFLFMDDKIFLQYHYEQYYITATTREFIKPPKPSYGEEIRFDRSLTKSYKSNPDHEEPSNMELYQLLLDQLNAESLAINACIDRSNDLQQLKITRDKETRQSTLTFSIFDPLRNDEAKRIRKQRLKMIALREETDRREKADHLEPYLLKHSVKFTELCSQIKQGSISFEASQRAFDDCLKDYADYQETTLKEVERMLHETNEEMGKFKVFIVKFKDHFTAENIEQITKEGEGLQRFKHVLQKRLAELKSQNEIKLKELTKEILRDDRLNAEFRQRQREANDNKE